MDMTQDRVERRLAAVLAADVVGYSRLMEVDEAGTLARLKSVRMELIDPAIANCKGRLIKTTGDGLLVEFQSVTEALRCAVDFQQRMARRNRDMPASRTLLYRIGINLGDVIVEDGDIFGDGVNVAARLESIAEPGGICISAAVRDQVADRLDVGYEDLGEQQVKNIKRPIRVFKVLLDSEAPGSNKQAATEAAVPRMDARKPSIAVLPFLNMSGDPEQEFFADGLTEDIITELSRFRQLLVISRNAVFVHKGKPVKAQQIAREFGVDYVVEGSVRKAVSRVRVTVQLIDGETETHLWAERYDRALEDIFAIQDEVTSSIAATLFGRVEAAKQDRVQRKPTENMAAYEYVLTGKVLHHWSNREANAKAVQMLDRAIELDPNYAHAHAWKGCVIGQAWMNGWSEDPAATLKLISGELKTALALDDNDADVHRILAALNLIFNAHDKAIYHQDCRTAGRGTDLAWESRGGYRVDSPGDAAQPLSSGTILEPSRTRPIHRTDLCRCDRVVQQVDRAGLQPSRLFGRVIGAIGKSHSCRSPCARSPGTTGGVHDWQFLANASLPAALGLRTRS